MQTISFLLFRLLAFVVKNHLKREKNSKKKNHFFPLPPPPPPDTPRIRIRIRMKIFARIRIRKKNADPKPWFIESFIIDLNYFLRLTSAA